MEGINSLISALESTVTKTEDTIAKENDNLDKLTRYRNSMQRKIVARQQERTAVQIKNVLRMLRRSLKS